MEKSDYKYSENTELKKKVFLLVLGIATILVALIGMTFAYFTAIINNVNGNQSVTVTTATVEGIVYTASDPIVLLNATPGEYAESSFKINNPNATVPIIYDVKLVTDVNDFEKTDGDNQLVITVSGGQLTSSRVIDMTDSTLTGDKEVASGITIEPGATDTYQIRLDFFDTGVAQDTNQTKSFLGHIEVSQRIVTARGE